MGASDDAQAPKAAQYIGCLHPYRLPEFVRRFSRSPMGSSSFAGSLGISSSWLLAVRHKHGLLEKKQGKAM